MAGTFVQAVRADNTATNTKIVSGSITSTAGNTAACIVTYFGATTTVGLDALNTFGTWVEDVSLRHAAAGGIGTHVFTCDNLSAATAGLQADFGVSVTNRALYYIEFSGVDHYIAGVFPAYQVTPGSTNNAITSGNYAVTGNPNYLLGFGWDQTGGTATPALGSASSPQFTSQSVGWLFGGAINDVRVVDGRATSDGNVAVTFTSSSGGTDTYAALLLAFAESAATYTIMSQCMY